MSSKKVVLVTGSSSGFGKLAAQELAKRGHHVFATMRDVNGKNSDVAAELRAAGTQNEWKLDVVELDVTSQDSVDAAVAKVMRSAGRIDVLVNNAGIMATGFDEAFTDEQVEAVFAVNVFGAQRMARAVLPAMREQRSGLLVWVSSNMAQITFPFAGVYTATKRAVEGFAASYRYQLSPLGIDSVIVQPGGYPTSLFSKMIYPADGDRVAAYGPLASMPQEVFGGFAASLQGDDAPDPAEVAHGIADLVDARPGERALANPIDQHTREGMQAINQTVSQVQQGVFGAFGMSGLLQIASE